MAVLCKYTFIRKCLRGSTSVSFAAQYHACLVITLIDLMFRQVVARHRANKRRMPPWKNVLPEVSR